MKLTKITTFLILLLTTFTYAQLKVDAELRPRFEYRHGYKTLFPNQASAAVFVSQRTRLNIGYEIEKLNFYLSFQDVRVWGDVPQLNTSDSNGIAIHQAWANIKFNEVFFVKAGRQEIIYDDSRIFGNVGWAQQGRSHDAVLINYKKNMFKAAVGLAFNQSKERVTGTVLETNTYKAMQYLWLHQDWNNFSGSFLFLNNGMQATDGIKYSQTVGTHLKSKGTVDVAANLYYQFGKDKMNNDLSAYLVGLEGNYAVSTKTKIGVGFELQSGNDSGTITDKENNAFTPFYGTNHKFNGFMDYFYVGNHANNVGLLDVYLKADFKLNEKSNLMASLHNFSAAATYDEKQLGTELDMVYSYKLQKYVTIKAGYSHMFESKGMEILKGNSDGNTNNWGWIMLVVKPTLFKGSIK